MYILTNWQVGWYSIVQIFYINDDFFFVPLFIEKRVNIIKDKFGHNYSFHFFQFLLLLSLPEPLPYTCVSPSAREPRGTTAWRFPAPYSSLPPLLQCLFWVPCPIILIFSIASDLGYVLCNPKNVQGQKSEKSGDSPQFFSLFSRIIAHATYCPMPENSCFIYFIQLQKCL